MDRKNANVLPRVSWPPAGVFYGSPHIPPYTSPSPPWSDAFSSLTRPTTSLAEWWSWWLVRRTAINKHTHARAPEQINDTHTRKFGTQNANYIPLHAGRKRRYNRTLKKAGRTRLSATNVTNGHARTSTNRTGEECIYNQRPTTDGSWRLVSPNGYVGYVLERVRLRDALQKPYTHTRRFFNGNRPVTETIIIIYI